MGNGAKYIQITLLCKDKETSEMHRFILFFCLGHLPLAVFSQDTLNQTDLTGLKQGYWRKSNQNGLLIYEGHFKDNIPFGKFTYYYANGKVRTLSVISDEGRVARSTSWFPNGRMMAKGKYINEKKDSVWQFFSEIDGSLVSEENYEAGVKEGIENVFYPGKGIAEIITWRQGKKEGLWEQFYDDGTRKLKGTYRNDEKEGALETFFVSGKILCTGQYKNGHQDGIWSYYDEMGNLTIKEYYESGVLVKTK